MTTIIPVVPLRAAAPSGNEGATTGGPLLVPWSLKEKESDDDSDVQVVSSVGDAPHDRSPQTLNTMPLVTGARLAQHPVARQIRHRKVPASSPQLRPLVPKGMTPTPR
jgi:hypothetical protein